MPGHSSQSSMVVNHIDVTIIIRAKNEQALVGSCLQRLHEQTTSLRFEILLIDSGSQDRTLAIAKSWPDVRIECIPARTFNYGSALNLGVQLARGRFNVALSAHCVPVDQHWLNNLVRPIIEDDRIAGTFGCQVPWPDCEPMERRFLNATFSKADATYFGVNAGDHCLSSVFSNANACFRRDLALACPFQCLSYCEDRVWAYEMLRQGHGIAYCSKAAVYHSHNRNLMTRFRQGIALGRTHGELGIPVKSFREREWFGLKKAYWTYVWWDEYCATLPMDHKPRSAGVMARHVASDVGEWIGFRRAIREKRHRQIANSASHV